MTCSRVTRSLTLRFPVVKPVGRHQRHLRRQSLRRSFTVAFFHLYPDGGAACLLGRYQARPAATERVEYQSVFFRRALDEFHHERDRLFRRMIRARRTSTPRHIQDVFRRAVGDLVAVLHEQRDEFVL